MVTRATLITEKYTILTTELKSFFDAELFPSLDNIDIADLCFFVTMSFMGVDSPLDFHDKIIEIIIANGFKITEEQMIIVVPLISDFVIFLRNV
jgi:hypothetical protein